MYDNRTNVYVYSYSIKKTRNVGRLKAFTKSILKMVKWFLIFLTLAVLLRS
jgi:hypothetical protein